jgi:hypothetical protein
MTNDALEAALNASATAGMSIVKGGIRPELHHEAPRLHPRAGRGHDQHQPHRQVTY